MKHWEPTPRLSGWMAAVGIVLGLAGCGRNQGALPAGFAPEGLPSNASFLSIGVDSLQQQDGSFAPGVSVTVLDNTTTDGFVLYRKADGENAFQKIQTFTLPFDRTFNSAYRTFVAVDWDLQEFRGAQYMARGTVNGFETHLSPLTTIATLPSASLDALLPDSFDMLAPIDTADTDSLPTMSWEAVSNAQRYVFQVVRSDGHPFAVILTPPDGSTTYTMQSKLGLVIHELILPRATFFWSVFAIDAGGFVVGRAPAPQIFIVSLPPLPD